MKAIKTIVTVNDQEVTVWLEPQEAANYIHKKIEGLQEKIEALRSLSPTEMADETAKSVLPKLKKVPPTELLKEYTFAELKTARRGESLAGFLKENGIADSLFGSANRGYKQALAALTALRAAGISDSNMLESAVRAALGSKDNEWKELVVTFALANN